MTAVSGVSPQEAQEREQREQEAQRARRERATQEAEARAHAEQLVRAAHLRARKEEEARAMMCAPRTVGSSQLAPAHKVRCRAPPPRPPPPALLHRSRCVPHRQDFARRQANAAEQPASPPALGAISTFAGAAGPKVLSPPLSLPSSRTDWTRLVPPPVLTGHVSSKVLSPPAQPRVLNVRRQSPGGAPPAATVGARGGLVGLHASRGGSGSDSTPVGAGAGSLARPWEPGRGRSGGGSGDGGGALVGGEATSPGKV